MYSNWKTWDLECVMVKGGDDVRQELLAGQLLQEFQLIFQKAKLNLWLRPFQVVVTSSDSGLIEYVKNTVSIDYLKKKFHHKLLHVIFREAFEDDLFSAKKNFIESLAAYSLVCYFLQVKDRHNGNLLLDDEGHIIHIDFGFMFSNSPGNISFETSPFKLSQ